MRATSNVPGRKTGARQGTLALLACNQMYQVSLTLFLNDQTNIKRLTEMYTTEILKWSLKNLPI